MQPLDRFRQPFARADKESQRRAERQVQESLERGTYVFPGLWSMIVYMTGVWHQHRAVSVLMTVAWSFAVFYRIRALREARSLREHDGGRSRLLMRLSYLITALMWGVTEMMVGYLTELSWGVAFCLCVSGIIGAISWTALAPDYSHGSIQQAVRSFFDAMAVLLAGDNLAEAWPVIAVVVVYTFFAWGQGFGAYRRFWTTMRDSRALEELYGLGVDLEKCQDADAVGSLVKTRLQPLLQLESLVVLAAGTQGSGQSSSQRLSSHDNHLEFSRQTPLDEHERTIALSFLNLASSAFDHHKMLEELKLNACTDGLTQVYNRSYFFDRAEGSLKAARRVTLKTGGQVAMAVLMLDIDHFKLVNDNFGHSAGDEVLKTVAQLCRRNLREVDVFGRLGGEEFCALLLGSNLEETATIAAERLRSAVAREAVRVDGRSIPVTVSIGVAELEPEESLDAALKRADKALYRAKNGGRNRVCSAGG